MSAFDTYKHGTHPVRICGLELCSSTVAPSAICEGASQVLALPELKPNVSGKALSAPFTTSFHSSKN